LILFGALDYNVSILDEDIGIFVHETTGLEDPLFKKGN
jgi:hypothetical protein